MNRKIMLFILISTFAVSCFSDEIQNDDSLSVLVLPASMSQEGATLDYGWKAEEIEFFNEIVNWLYGDPQIRSVIVNPLFDTDMIKGNIIGYLPNFNLGTSLYSPINGTMNMKRNGVDFCVEIVMDPNDRAPVVYILVESSINPNNTSKVRINKTNLKGELTSLLKSMITPKTPYPRDFIYRTFYSQGFTSIVSIIDDRKAIVKYKGKNIDDIPPDEAFKIKPRDLSFDVQIINPTIEFVSDGESLKYVAEKLSDSLSDSELHVLSPDRSNKGRRHFICHLNDTHEEKDANGVKWCIMRVDVKVSSDSDDEVFSDYQIVFMPVRDGDFAKTLIRAREKASKELAARFKWLLFKSISDRAFDQKVKEIEDKNKRISPDQVVK